MMKEVSILKNFNKKSYLFTLLVTFIVMMAMATFTFAAEIKPFNADATKIRAYIDDVNQSYSVFVTSPSNVSKISMTANLYQKKILGYKKVDSMTASSNGNFCNKSKAYLFERGENYKLEVTAKVYSDGVWDTLTSSFTA